MKTIINNLGNLAVVDPGEPGDPLFLDQNEAQTAENLFLETEPLPYLSLRGIYITSGYAFFGSIENFSAYCPVLRGSILLPPRHPNVFARMARRQLNNYSIRDCWI